MKNLLIIISLFCIYVPLRETAAAEQPNILFLIADDASRHFGKSYHCDWVNTPNIDKLAREGLVFDNSYVVSAKCAPCRAALLTGRNSWQNEEAANHQNYFPAKFPAFGEKLQDAGFRTGSVGKVWGPGIANDKDGNKRDFGLPAFKAQGAKGPGAAFAAFLDVRRNNAPFFFWFGSHDPHRGYAAGSGRKAGKQPADIDRVPAYWPDNDTVRNDMLDYAIEVERFDSHVGEIVEQLEIAGLSENTLVIVTSDHGMPFPRVKGHTFDDAHRVPTVIRWPNGIENPGRRVADLVSFIDFAPTFLELAGTNPAESGMDLTGHSISDLLADQPQTKREFLLIGRERNDVYARPGSAAGLGYPARGIRSGNFLYIRNFAPDRWPCGNPELGLKDTDGSPTKTLIKQLGPGSRYWQHAFGKRPAEMLFNIKQDPDCVKNLADLDAHAATKKRLSEAMMAELKKQGDPRAFGKGDVFDNYRTVKKSSPGWEQGPVPKNPRKSKKKK